MPGAGWLRTGVSVIRLARGVETFAGIPVGRMLPAELVALGWCREAMAAKVPAAITISPSSTNCGSPRPWPLGCFPGVDFIDLEMETSLPERDGVSSRIAPRGRDQPCAWTWCSPDAPAGSG